MYNLRNFAAVFQRSEAEINETLYRAGFDPTGYDDAGENPSYLADAFAYLCDLYPQAESPAPVVNEWHHEPAAPMFATCKTVAQPGETSCRL